MKRVLLLVAVAAVLCAGPVYDVMDLGSLGGNNAAAFAINASGTAVGHATDQFGKLWAVQSKDGAWSPIAGDAMADDINAAGAIAGTLWANGEAFAVVWQGGSPLIAGGVGSYAMGINDAGLVTGMADGRVFVTTGDGQAIDLGLPADASWASGYDINLTGLVAGYSMQGSFFRAFVVSQGGGFQSLGTLGGKNSYAMAINDSGTVAGHAQTGAGYLHAAIWAGGGIVDLGTLGGGNSYAYGLDNAGHVVGYSNVAGEDHAFLYRDGVMLDLNDLIDPASGWLLHAAYGVNEAGQIVGQGTYAGVQHAFRLDVAGMATNRGPMFAILMDSPTDAAAAVPEPNTWILLVTGVVLCALGTFRRKQR